MISQIITVILIFLASYLLGSIPFGLIAGYFYKVDIRKKGSGNIGATNVLRILGAFPAAIVFSADMLKGTASVLLAIHYIHEPWINISAGICALIGHSFSIFLKGKGGKGAATGLGIILGLAPNLFLYTLLIFIGILATSKYVSLSTLASASSLLFLMIITQKPLPYSLISGLGAVIIFIRHLSNIQRLLAGTEAKIGEKA
ncbi:MAG: glycerol-3-phosphate 1-O-acyltransferase PlsY [bacterium]